MTDILKVKRRRSSNGPSDLQSRVVRKATIPHQAIKQSKQTSQDILAPIEPGPHSNDILTLNIGGKISVQTQRRTLTVVTDSLLSARFSVDWDHSLPRDMDGNVFVDCDPDLFLPLLEYLRALAASPNHLQRGLLPITPKFSDVQTEAAFRTMVDSMLLTNILYNYEIQRYENERFITVSQTTSIYDYVMDCLHPIGASPPSCVSYSLGRPVRSLGSCHERKVQGFTATCDLSITTEATRVVVGWTFRGPDRVSGSNRHIQSIVFDTKLKAIKWIYNEGKWVHGKAVRSKYANELVVTVKCKVPLGTRDLEWYIDGALVASTSRKVRHGDWKTAHGLGQLGLELCEQDSYEWIPYIKVYGSGGCQFSSVELED